MEWAASEDNEQEYYEGVLDRWHTKDKILMVKWEGWTQNKQTALDRLENDQSGASLELELLPYADGRPAPVVHVPPPPRRGDTGPEMEAENSDVGDGSDGSGEQQQPEGADDEPAPKTVDKHGQQWTLRTPTYIKEDARSEARTGPALDKGDIVCNDIAEFFAVLTPGGWWQQQLDYTNPKLLDTDATNRKVRHMQF